MLIVVGLGNPTAEYQATRHNVGFMVIDQLAQSLAENLDQTFNWSDSKKFQAQWGKIGDWCLIKPQTYMNNSGQAVAAILNFFKIKPQADRFEQLIVVHDDLDIHFGQYKINFAKGPQIHHGLQSIYQHLNSEQFWHVRIGTDARTAPIPGEKYVLQPFLATEQATLKTVKTAVVNDILTKSWSVAG